MYLGCWQWYDVGSGEVGSSLRYFCLSCKLLFGLVVFGMVGLVLVWVWYELVCWVVYCDFGVVFGWLYNVLFYSNWTKEEEEAAASTYWCTKGNELPRHTGLELPTIGRSRPSICLSYPSRSLALPLGFLISLSPS